ncbi:hypothetical protein OROGR_010637 [Orobanche gracilis]
MCRREPKFDAKRPPPKRGEGRVSDAPSLPEVQEIRLRKNARVASRLSPERVWTAPLAGNVHDKRRFAIGAFLWPDQLN